MISKTFTRAAIERWRPCVPLDDLVPAAWSGTVVDMLRADHVRREYRLWAVLREDCLDAATLLAFGDWCEAQAQAVIHPPAGPPLAIEGDQMRQRVRSPKRWAIDSAEWFCNCAASSAALVACGEDCAVALTFNDTWLRAWEAGWEATMQLEIDYLLALVG